MYLQSAPCSVFCAEPFQTEQDWEPHSPRCQPLRLCLPSSKLPVGLAGATCLPSFWWCHPSFHKVLTPCPEYGTAWWTGHATGVPQPVWPWCPEAYLSFALHSPQALMSSSAGLGGHVSSVSIVHCVPSLSRAAACFPTTLLRYGAHPCHSQLILCSSMAFKSSELSNHRHHQFQNIFLSPERNPAPLHPHHPSAPHPSMDLPVVEITSTNGIVKFPRASGPFLERHALVPPTFPPFPWSPQAPTGLCSAHMLEVLSACGVCCQPNAKTMKSVCK